MAQFSMQEYQAQQEAKRQNNNFSQKSNIKTNFINSYLKNDGDDVIVRFPYHSLDDMEITTVHLVKDVFPNDVFGKKVICDGTKDCILCKQGLKIMNRFFVKALIYVINPETNQLEILPAIWDRPAMFADTEIKNALQEYGDLTEVLFRIKRSGYGTETRYNLIPLFNKNKYNDDVYKADFSLLDNVDPLRILTKSMQDYLNIVCPDKSIASEETNDVVEDDYKEPPFMTDDKPLTEMYNEPVEYKPNQVETTQNTKVNTEEPRAARRYTF